MSTRGRFQDEVSQIESIAETKGIDLDDIVVNETTTDEGDELITFRILETAAETEEDSVGVQVSKMPSVQTGEMAFRNEVQNKLTALKRYLSGEQPSEQVADDDESESETEDDPSQDSTEQTSSPVTYTDAVEDGPGSTIDAQLFEMEQRLDDLEERVEAIEEKSEALDGLQKIVGQTEDNE